MLYLKVKEVISVLSTLLENPPLAICIVFAIWLIAKAFKLSAKIVKWIIICGVVYIGLNLLSII